MFFEKKAPEFFGRVFLHLTLWRRHFPRLSFVEITNVLCQMAVEAFAKIEHLVPRQLQQQPLSNYRVFGGIRPDTCNALKFPNNVTPSLNVVLVYESAKKMKQANPHRFWAVVVDLRLCTVISRRERREKRLFSHQPPALNKLPSQTSALACAIKNLPPYVMRKS